MDTSLYQSKTSQKIRAEGRAEGRAEAREEGLRQQRALIIVAILRLRDIELGDVDRERILGCEDADQLKVWFDRAVNAEAAADVFGER